MSGQNEEVYRFADEEDRVEYKPKGLAFDVIKDMLGSLPIARFCTKTVLIRLGLVLIVLFIAMNFRTVLGWSHSGYTKTQGQVASLKKTSAVKKVAAKQPAVAQPKPTPVSDAKAQSSKEAAMKLLDAAPTQQAPKVDANSAASQPPIVIAKPKIAPVVSKPPVDLARPVTPPIRQPKSAPKTEDAMVLLKQVEALASEPVEHDKPLSKHAQMQKTIAAMDQQIVSMHQQQSQLEDNVRSLLRELKDTQASIDSLQKAQQAQKQGMAKVVDKKPAPVKQAPQADQVKKKVVAQKKTPAKPLPNYRVTAMIYGRAWIEDRDTKRVLSIRVGDAIPGLKGRVKNIYLNDFFVETTQGEYIYDYFK